MNRPTLLSAKHHQLNNEQQASIYALLTVILWSTVATAFKIGLRQQEPAQLIFIASVTTVAILAGILLLSGKFGQVFRLKPQQYLMAIILGFLNPFAYYVILFEAYSLLPAQVAQPINMIWPVVLVLLSVPLLKQKLNWKHLLALVISFAGVFLISSQGDFFSLKKSNPLGIALGLGSSVIWSLYWIFNVRYQVDVLVKLFLSFLAGTLFLLMYLPLFSSLSLEVNTSFYAGIYIGFFEIGFSFIFWMKALSLTSHNARIANLIYIVPFVSLLFIHFVLKEQIYITTIAGMVLIISGILFQQMHKKN